MKSNMQRIREQAEKVYNEWGTGLEKDVNGKPGWGVTCAGLVILERLLTDYTLDVSHHTTNNGTQLRGQGNPLGRKILARWGITIPQDAVYEKCEENLNDGKRVYLLVAERNLEQAREKAKHRRIESYIVIKSIESFVGQNIDELAIFSTDLLGMVQGKRKSM